MPTTPIKPANDRSASAESMNMLKGLINDKVEKVEPAPIPKVEIPEPPKIVNPTPSPQPSSSVKEVPEDVLRKVLE